MRVAETILEQLGGHRFTVMTGSSHYVSDGDSLRMRLARNSSGANRLVITYHPGPDLYSMHFFKETQDHLNMKTMTWTQGKTTLIDECDGLQWEDLQPYFTRVTGLYTHL